MAKPRKQARKRPSPKAEEPSVPPITVNGGLETLRRFVGQWIAIDPQREVRASGTVSGKVLEEAWAAGIEEPELLFVQPDGFMGRGG